MCLNSFQNEVKLLEHRSYCKLNKEARITLLNNYDDSIVDFKNYSLKMKVPFVIYADFESFVKQIKEKICYTIKIQKHEPISFVYIIVYTNGDFGKNIFEYFGEDASKVIYEKFKEEAIYIASSYLDNVKKMIITKKQKEEYENATICHICEGRLSNPKEVPRAYALEERRVLEKCQKRWEESVDEHEKQNDGERTMEEYVATEIMNAEKVCDYDKLTGLYRGASHYICAKKK